jgi:hypothetical protein
MEKIRLMNFLKVTTKVTVRDAHSVVRINTPEIQIYLIIVKKINFAYLVVLLFNIGNFFCCCLAHQTRRKRLPRTVKTQKYAFHCGVGDYC